MAVRTQLARLARKRAGLDAERLGGVAGRDRNGGIGFTTRKTRNEHMSPV